MVRLGLHGGGHVETRCYLLLGRTLGLAADCTAFSVTWEHSLSSTAPSASTIDHSAQRKQLASFTRSKYLETRATHCQETVLSVCVPQHIASRLLRMSPANHHEYVRSGPDRISSEIRRARTSPPSRRQSRPKAHPRQKCPAVQDVRVRTQRTNHVQCVE